jgi:hypothetical protein
MTAALVAADAAMAQAQPAPFAKGDSRQARRWSIAIVLAATRRNLPATPTRCIAAPTAG